MKLKQINLGADKENLGMRYGIKNTHAVLRKLTMIAMLLFASDAFAEIAVSDVQVFSGHPWKEVVVGYTIAGMSDEMPIVRLIATDAAARKRYTAKTVFGAKVTEGRHTMRWNAVADGVKFSSTNVVFTVSLVTGVGVQLWENGPYWAECNVGATKPEEYGYYFWWGDTVGYKRNAANNGWISVKDGSGFLFTRENCPTRKTETQLLSAGYIDATGNLVVAHDAASSHLGTPWRMPSYAEYVDLRNNCDLSWTQRNGVNGFLVKGRGAYATKSIFLPAAGYGYDSSLWEIGSCGSYWSSTPYSDPQYLSFTSSWFLEFDSEGWFGPACGNRRFAHREEGFSVRPLRGFAQ